jgi:3-oxoacyl-[acyl-carrier protein] reductase
MGRLEGKRVLVTGASSGIGREVANRFAREGARVAVGGRNPERTRRTVDEIQAAGGQAVEAPGDVSQVDGAKAVVAAAVDGLGGLDALVNNAGIAPRVRADILDATEDSFDELIAVNLKGPYFLSQSVARHWIERRGQSRLPGGYKLVFVSSASAVRVSVNRGEYCVSKAGLAMAAKLWAVRLAGEAVQVYEVRPGIMATDMTAAVKEKYDRAIADGLVPEGRWGTSADVGLAVSALLKGSFPFSTGDVINIDGGLHLERL